MRPTGPLVLAFALVLSMMPQAGTAAASDPKPATHPRAEKRLARSGEAKGAQRTPEQRAARRAARAAASATAAATPKAKPHARSKEARRAAKQATVAAKRAGSPLLAESFASGAPAGWAYSPQGEGSGVCTLVCPDNASVPTDPGACSATLTLPPAYPVGDCGPVLCSIQVRSPRGGLMLAPGGAGTGDCCSANGTPGCSDTTCEAAVCVQDPFCCDIAWDGICASEAATTCSVCGGGETLPVGTTTIVCAEQFNRRTPEGLPAVSSCCIPTGAQGCDDTTCQSSVCSVDPFCCNTAWDSICVGEAQSLCSPLCGESNTCTYDLTVFDNEPPALVCPADIFAIAPAGALGWPVDYVEPTPTDNCPGATAGCAPPSGSDFPVGTTITNCVATDAAGLTAGCDFDVTVSQATIQEIPTLSELGLIALAALLAGAAFLVLRRPG